MSKHAFYFTLSFLLFFCPVFLFAEEITITSYYPSPYGVYNELRAKKMAIGDNYIDSGNYTWESADGDGGEVDYNADLVVEGNLGIGTSNPNFKTDIQQDVTMSGDINPGSAQLSVGGVSTPGKRMLLGYDVNSNGYGYIKAGNYGVSWTSLALQPNGGNVGIGTTSPNVNMKLHVNGEIVSSALGAAGGNIRMVCGYYGIFLRNDGSDTYFLLTNSGDQYGIWNSLRPFVINNASGNVILGQNLTVNGVASCNLGVWSGSDLRWKKDISILDNPLEKLLRLRGVKFDWKQKEFKDKNFPSGRQIGIIAQEMEKEFPELVMTDKEGYKSIAYDKFTAVLLEAVKEQEDKIESLQDSINSLKSRLDKLQGTNHHS